MQNNSVIYIYIKKTEIFLLKSRHIIFIFLVIIFYETECELNSTSFVQAIGIKFKHIS